MKRREFITSIGGVAAASVSWSVSWPLAARAEERPRRIGVLMGVAESDPQGQARTAAFRQALQELKWTDGRVQIDYRWAAADAAKARAYAAELIGLAPDVILGTNTPTVRALHQLTKTIPIVFAGLSDPVGDGLHLRRGTQAPDPG